MNDDEMEKKLRELPNPVLPEAWRGSILQAARQAAVNASRQRENGPALLLYWRRLFLENPVTAGGLTFLWLLILSFKMGTPVDPSEKELIAHVDPHQPGDFILLQNEVRLAEFWQDQPEPRQIP